MGWCGRGGVGWGGGEGRVCDEGGVHCAGVSGLCCVI